jgi:hypothetical protein
MGIAMVVLGVPEQGLLCVICRWNEFGGRGQFQGRREVRADASGFFGGRDHPLIEGVADAAALGLILNHDKADEISA